MNPIAILLAFLAALAIGARRRAASIDGTMNGYPWRITRHDNGTLSVRMVIPTDGECTVYGADGFTSGDDASAFITSALMALPPGNPAQCRWPGA